MRLPAEARKKYIPEDGVPIQSGIHTWEAFVKNAGVLSFDASLTIDLWDLQGSELTFQSATSSIEPGSLVDPATESTLGVTFDSSTLVGEFFLQAYVEVTAGGWYTSIGVASQTKVYFVESYPLMGLSNNGWSVNDADINDDNPNVYSKFMAPAIWFQNNRQDGASAAQQGGGLRACQPRRRSWFGVRVCLRFAARVLLPSVHR